MLITPHWSSRTNGPRRRSRLLASGSKPCLALPLLTCAHGKLLVGSSLLILINIPSSHYCTLMITGIFRCHILCCARSKLFNLPVFTNLIHFTLCAGAVRCTFSRRVSPSLTSLPMGDGARLLFCAILAILQISLPPRL